MPDTFIYIDLDFLIFLCIIMVEENNFRWIRMFIKKILFLLLKRVFYEFDKIRRVGRENRLLWNEEQKFRSLG